MLATSDAETAGYRAAMDEPELHAIPTEYHGVTFRSRFEANTAYLLDALGLGWEYEGRSFLLPSGIHYRPDFWVPEIKLWIECRGYTTPAGEEQIRAFQHWVWTGALAPDGTLRPESHWDDPGEAYPTNFHEPPTTVDYLVLREPASLTEYVGRARSEPSMSEPQLGFCKHCLGWGFNVRAGGSCRRCRAFKDWSTHLAIMLTIAVVGSTLFIERIPAPVFAQCLPRPRDGQ